MAPLRTAVLALVAVVTACRGAGSAAASTSRLTEICKTTTNMAAQVCDCVGEKAGKELSADALAFLVATMDKQESTAEELRSKLSLEEITKAGMFFVTAPASCASASTPGTP